MIWCVEDDSDIRDIEAYTLNSTGFEANGFSDGSSFFAALANEKPDLIILDIMLPGEDGVEILKRLKNSSETSAIPVIMATAKGAEHDKIQSLDLGADDYLVKPFGMMEMVSRVKAVLRRCGAKDKKPLLKHGGLTVNPDERRVTADGERIDLTYKEFEILLLFMRNPGKVFTRERLFNDVWGSDYIGESRTIDMHIRTLRRKLGEYGSMIETVRNIGYRIEAAEK